VASLKIHDALFQEKYDTTTMRWIAAVRQNLDPEYGLLPHSVYPNGNVREGARGSSQSLMLNFLIEIDTSFANEQFRQYKQLFLTKRLGLPGIREYPKGAKGYGDVDSGPVILGIGGAASIVGQRTMGKYHNWESFRGLRNAIETFGVGMTIHKKKRYLFGLLPMSDAFIAWSNSLEKSRIPPTHAFRGQWYFHIISLVIIIILTLLRRKRKTSTSR